MNDEYKLSSKILAVARGIEESKTTLGKCCELKKLLHSLENGDEKTKLRFKKVQDDFYQFNNEVTDKKEASFSFLNGILSKLESIPVYEPDFVTGSLKKAKRLLSGHEFEFGPLFIDAVLSALRGSIFAYARWGNFSHLDGLAKCRMSFECISFIDNDPIQVPSKKVTVVKPDSVEGRVLAERLGYGFHEIEVYPPHEFDSKQKYHIQFGVVDESLQNESIKYLHEIGQVRTWEQLIDRRPGVVLNDLLFYSNIPDWKWIDFSGAPQEGKSYPELFGLSNQPSCKELDQLYINFHMQCFASRVINTNDDAAFSDTLNQKVKRLLYFIETDSCPRGHELNKNYYKSAEEYAWEKSQELLERKTEKERNRYTKDDLYEDIIELAEMDLSPKLFKKNINLKKEKKND